VGSTILDAFAGGPPRGLVASAMGYRYVGYEIREEQINENNRVLNNLGLLDGVTYINSSGVYLDGAKPCSFDMALTCPPYHDLEKYSDLPEDLSNLGSYEEFNQAMFDCAKAHRRVMKPGAFVCIVVGLFRNKKTGELRPFPEDTVVNFREVGFIYHQNIILSKNFASAAVRAANAWTGKKLVPRHENLLVFKTP
jgi:DNA modification methylase